jgi:hypothetical protein
MNVKDTFQKFDDFIHTKLKLVTKNYIGDKPNPEDWAELLDTNEDFRREFQMLYNDDSIPEADDFTPEVLEDTYLNMEIALPCDGEGPEFAKVTK